MSNRVAFLLIVPLLAILLAAVTILNGIGLGFAGEGCRFHDGQSFRWGAAIETALAQLLFGLIFGMALAVLSVCLRRQIGIQRRMITWFDTTSVLGLALIMCGATGEALVCRLAPYYFLVSAMLQSGHLVLLAALALLALLYIQGLTHPTK